MRLALLMNRPDVDAMLDELTTEQVVEWQAYLEGINETDGWLQSSRIEAAIRNGFGIVLEAFGGEKLKPIEPSRLVPRFLPDETPRVNRVQSVDDISRRLRASVGG